MNYYQPFTIGETHEESERILYDMNRKRNVSRKPLVDVSIADIHFGAINPEYQYNVLTEQFTNVIKNIYFDMITINGDLFDHKFMSNSEVVMYAMRFIDDLCNICRTRPNNPTIVIVAGTLYHDAGQLKLFYHYITDTSVDIRIVESAKFEYIHGAKVLCIPEEYGRGEEFYENLLYHSGWYDMAVMHGTMEGALPYIKYQESGLHSERAPIFEHHNFRMCTGFVTSGHIHKAMCLDGYFYYAGSPLRWKHGEEEDKGFMIFLHDLDSGRHAAEFIPIISRSYITLNIDDHIDNDPMQTIQNIKSYYENNSIDFMRIKISEVSTEEQLANVELIKKYFRHNNKIKVFVKRKQTKELINEDDKESSNKFDEYKFLLDESLSPEEKLIMYMNQKKGYEYITLEEYNSLLKD